MALTYEGRHSEQGTAANRTGDGRHRYTRLSEMDTLEPTPSPVPEVTARHLARAAVDGGRHRYTSLADIDTDPQGPAVGVARVRRPGFTSLDSAEPSFRGASSVASPDASVNSDNVQHSRSGDAQPVAPENPSPRTPEARTGRVRTFADAERKRHVFDDSVVVNMLNGTLLGEAQESPGGPDLKRWVDRVRAPQAERRLAGDADRIGRLHTKTVKMIARNQQLVADADTVPAEHRRYLDQYADLFRMTADDSSERRGNALAISIHEWLGGKTRGAGAVGEKLLYPPLVLSSTEGNINVTDRFGDKTVNGIRPTISYQEDVGGQYIHWLTRPLAAEAAKNGAVPKHDRRIYLSPDPEQGPDVFEDLMTEFDRLGLKVTGKMYDRCSEAAVNARELAQGKDVTSRAEGIVLAMSQDDCEQILAMVNDYADKHTRVFAHRPKPRIPVRIRDGIAVGGEPAAKNESLTSHRLGVLNTVIDRVRATMGVKDISEKIPIGQRGRAITAFRRIWNREAAKAGVNPNNMSFDR